MTDLSGLADGGTVDGASDVGAGDAATDAPGADGPAEAAIDAGSDGCFEGGTPTEVGLPATTVVNVSTSPAIVLGVPVSAGDLILVGLKINNASTVSLSALGDDHNDTYQTTSYKTAGYTTIVAWTTAAQAFSSTTITGTLNGTANTVLVAAAFTGLVTPLTLDVSQAGAGTGAAMTSGLAQTSSPHDLIFGFGVAAGTSTTLTAGTSFSGVASASGTLLEDRIVDCAGNYEATGTYNLDAGTWVMMMTAFPAK
jgi:hypothetical protein